LWSSRILLRTLPPGQAPVGLEVMPDARVLVFTFGVSVVSALLFGLMPALRATRHSVSEAMKQTREAASTFPRFRLDKLLAAMS